MSTPYLFRHPDSGIYYFRIAIPRALKARLKQREWKKSLKTRDPIDAKRTVRLVTVQVEYLFRELAQGHSMAKRQDDSYSMGLTLAGFLKRPDGTVEVERVELDPDKVENELQLAREVLGTQAVPKTITSVTCLADVIKEYCEELVHSGNWTRKTEQENKAIYDLLVRIIGNVSMSDISHEVARKYKQILMKLPPNINKSTKYRGKPIEDILAMPPDQTMAISTVNKNLTRAASFFDWAVKHGYVDTNYFNGLTLKKAKKASEEREVFTPGDLELIFAQKPFAQLNFKHSYYYWLPLLGLFTGARINELCQLYLEDIYEDKGIWVISINDRQDKQIKTKASQRIIPLHPTLLRLGLIQHVQGLLDQGEVRLFPELMKGRDGYSQAASKWFSRFRKRIGLFNLDPPRDFHSFRHTLVTELKNQGIPEQQVAAITGHNLSGITYSRYGKDYGSQVLFEVIQQLDFDDVLKSVRVYVQ